MTHRHARTARQQRQELTGLSSREHRSIAIRPHPPPSKGGVPSPWKHLCAWGYVEIAERKYLRYLRYIIISFLFLHLYKFENNTILAKYRLNFSFLLRQSYYSYYCWNCGYLSRKIVINVHLHELFIYERCSEFDLIIFSKVL